LPIDFTKPTPLFRQIMEDIKSQIESGQLKVGDRIGSHHELAQKYNVSLITIKKAVAELINEKVLFSRVGKGTYIARKPVKVDFTDHITIGLVLRDLNSPFFSRIVESVEKEVSENQCNLLVATSANRQDKEESQIQHYLDIGVSGLIIASMTRVYHASETIRKLQKENFPFVMVSYMADEDINYVGTDHEFGAFIATEHLIRLGYNKIGYINGEKGNLLGELRKTGFMKALRKYGKKFRKDFVFRMNYRGEWHDYESGYEIGKMFKELSERPEAMFVYNDLAALGFQRSLLDQGFRIPENVAIIGFDDIKRGVIAPVPLTTVHQPTDQIGRLAAGMVLKMIKGQSVEHRIILKPYLVIRNSCGAKQLGYRPEEEYIRYDTSFDH